jgi:cyclic-di-GMP-binding protein
MALSLSVPERATRLLAEVEAQPGKVEQWLASLPLLNIAEGGRKLAMTLHTYNRVELEPSLRLHLLELYRAPIRHVVTELQKQYVGLPLPLPDRNKHAAEQTVEFERELAYGYKHIVLAHAQSANGATRKPIESALPIQRAIRHLTEVLLGSYLSYSPHAQTLWQEIHALYAHAERLGVAGIEVDDPFSGSRGKSSVLDAYKHALLLDLSDPYHLPARMIQKIHQYLECNATLAMLHRDFDRIEPNCHFVIDLASDRAGMLYVRDAAPHRSEHQRLLNTVELARHIHSQLKCLQANMPVVDAELPSDFYKHGAQEMLLRLINVWGINPKRTFRRARRANSKLDVAVGLDAVAYWLNGARNFVLSAELFGPFPQRTNVGVFARVQKDAARPADYDYVSWDIKDESAGGMSLAKTGSLRRRVKVGDLIAARAAGADSWTISAVRWVRSANPSSVEIGIQRLAAAATAVVVKVLSDTNEESDFLPALLLPPIPALREPQTLVTACNLFRPNRVLYLDNGVRLSRLQATALLEATTGFERIEFVADTP